VNKVKVLAVDDSKTMLAMLAAQLRDSNFEVVATASSGPEAVEKFKKLKKRTDPDGLLESDLYRRIFG